MKKKGFCFFVQSGEEKKEDIETRVREMRRFIVGVKFWLRGFDYLVCVFDP